MRRRAQVARPTPQGETPSRMRRLLPVALAMLMIAAAAASWLLAELAGLGSAFTAKYLCSQVYVAGREAEAAAREDLPAFRSRVLAYVQWRHEPARARVQAHLQGLGRREAVYRPALGCTLALQGPPAYVPAPRPPPPKPSDPFAETETPPALARVVEAAFTEPDPGRPRRTRAVLILHNGRLLAERYAPGFDHTTRFPGWSMSKSVLNALIGVLVADGRLSLDAAPPIPEWTTEGDRRRAITLRQLLQMSSGLAFEEDYDNPRSDVIRMLYGRRDSAGYAAAKPLVAPPGSRFSYSTGTTAILSRLLADAAPEPWPLFAQRALFAPLGMTSAVIEPDSAGTPGLASFVWASARDWGRFGQLYLQDGVWQGRRLLPEGWVAFSRTPAPADPQREYGAHFWVRVPYPDRLGAGRPHLVPADAFHAVGHGAQYLTIIPSQGLVVVRLGLTLDPGSWDHEAFLGDVVAALAPDMARLP